jgi:hypothetical protein
MRLTDYTPTLNRCTSRQRETIASLAQRHGADTLQGCTRLYNGVVALRFAGARSYMIATTGGLR